MDAVAERRASKKRRRPDEQLRHTVLLAVYAVAVAGIIFTTVVIFSSVYTSSPVAGAGDGRNGKPLHLVGTSPFSSSSPPSTSPSPPPPPSPSPNDMFTRAVWDVPVDSKMPDLKSFQLTKEMVKHRAKDNIIFVTFGNHAFLDFILNWVKHLTDLNIFDILVGKSGTSQATLDSYKKFT
ncbi:hypothetical protein B296_00021832 [Ensete ventricosum]|uniref:Uncharacterized protein n=1 Tax=Ensete ventricosum TaxID=4639 RepID=A0A426YJI4_ENSVE|nr:hypothetical protein B296_00021832 [Ensete ventricosum]